MGGITISFVLSSFNFKRLLVTYIFISLAHASILLPLWILMHPVGMIHTIEYHRRQTWMLNQCLRMIFPKGVVFIVNEIGPSTEIWGIPYFNVTGVDAQDPISNLENVCPVLKVKCLCFHLNFRYSNLHFTTSWTIVEKIHNTIFDVQISVIWHCFSALGKIP